MRSGGTSVAFNQPLSSACSQLKLAPFPIKADEAVAWLLAFERTLTIQNVDRREWAKILPQYLTGPSLMAYAKLTLEQSLEYTVVKKEILKSFQLTPFRYFERFKTLKRSGSDSYECFAEKLQNAYQQYLDSKEISSYDQLFADNLYTQMYDALPPAVKRFCEEHQARTVKDLAKFGDLYYQLQNRIYSDRRSEVNRNTPHVINVQQRGHNVNTNRSFRQPYRGNFTRGPAVRHTGQQQVPRQNYNSNSQGWNQPRLQNWGANSNSVPAASFSQTNNPRMNNSYPTAYTDNHRQSIAFDDVITGVTNVSSGKEYFVPCFINGLEVLAIRDTGCNHSLISSRFVNPSDYTDDEITVQAALGHSKILKTAQVKLYAPRLRYEGETVITVGVLDDGEIPASFQFLLGNEIFKIHSHLRDILCVQDDRSDELYPAEIYRVHTRSETQRHMRGDVKNDINNDRVVQSQVQTSIMDRHDILTDKGCDNRENIYFKELVEGSQRDDVKDLCSTDSLNLNTHTEQSDIAETNATPVDNLTRQMNDTESEEYDTVARGRIVSVTGPDRGSSSGVLSPTEDAAPQGSDTLKTRDSAWKADTNGQCTDVTYDQEFHRLAKTFEGLIDDKNLTGTQRNFIYQQRHDPTLQHIFTKVLAGKSQEYLIINDILFQKKPMWTATDRDYLLVVPEFYRGRILQAAHYAMAHPGINRTRDIINTVFSWPKLKDSVLKTVKQCKECNLLSTSKKADRLPMAEREIVGKAFDTIQIDVVGPSMVPTKRRERYILLAVCEFTGYTQAWPVKDLKSETIASCLLHNWIFKFGTMSVLKCDQQSSLVSGIFPELLKILGVKQVTSSAYLHHGIGKAEAYVKTLERMLKHYVLEWSNSWAENLPYLLMLMD